MLPKSSITPTLRYVAGATPPWVTNNEPEISIIDPAKKSMNPKVARVSLIFSGPRRLTPRQIV